MNQDIILNIQTFLKLLEAARCEAVSQWDEAAFKRAVRWAEYAEQVGRLIRVMGLPIFR